MECLGVLEIHSFTRKKVPIMDNLIDLPTELLGTILSSLQPRNIRAFGLTCRAANATISPGNQMLWRDVYLNCFDKPGTGWTKSLKTLRRAAEVRLKEWDWYFRA